MSEWPKEAVLKTAGHSPAETTQTTEAASLEGASTPGSEDVLARRLALLVRNHPDLAAVIDAWPTLPEPVRTGIVAMVRAAKGDSE